MWRLLDPVIESADLDVLDLLLGDLQMLIDGGLEFFILNRLAHLWPGLEDLRFGAVKVFEFFDEEVLKRFHFHGGGS